MPLKLFTVAQIDVPNAGTRVQVSSTSIYASTVVFQAAEGNAGKIFVGDSSCSSSRGISLDAGEVFSVSADIAGSEKGREFNLSDFYVDAATNGDDVKVSYIKGA